VHPGLPPLPIDRVLDEIGLAVKSQRIVLVHASPASGKTTRIPPHLLDMLEGRILVLEPRRIAARLAAERVSSERGLPCGGLVGYQVRYDDRTPGGDRHFSAETPGAQKKCLSTVTLIFLGINVNNFFTFLSTS